MSLSCLDGLVGLAQRDCPCVSGGQPSGWNDSTTGYYLDDFDHGFPIKEALFANVDCGQSNVWDMLEEARSNAIRDVKTDILQALQQHRESPVINWRGSIGIRDNIGSYQSTQTVAGYQLRPRSRMRDAYFVLTGGWIDINQSKTVTVKVEANDVEFTNVSGTATCVANTWSEFTFSTPVSIPLHREAQWDIRYNVYYEPDGATARPNKLWCCTKPGWMQHLDIGGFSDNSVLTDALIPTHQEGAGFILNGYFTCNKLDWICNLDEMNGYDMTDLIGRLIQWRAAIGLMNRVLKSGKVNYYTLLGQEQLFGQRSKLAKKYENTVLWIAEHLPSGITSCWGCERDAPQITSFKS